MSQQHGCLGIAAAQGVDLALPRSWPRELYGDSAETLLLGDLCSIGTGISGLRDGKLSRTICAMLVECGPCLSTRA